VTEIAFGPFTIDLANSRITRDGAEVRLRPQAFQALKVLLRYNGRAVGHERMIAEAWDGTHVSRHTVDVTVGEVKKSLGEYGRWITHRPKAGYCLELPTSEELIRKGWHFWNRRTREGAELAISCFDSAAADCPGDFRAYDGLSECYLMLAVFGMQAPMDVYPKFLEAHERAVALGGLRPELRCNRAHGLHLFERRFSEAETELLKSIEEKPSLGAAYVRAGLLYANLQRLDDAVAMLERGRQVEPLLSTLPAAEVQIRVYRREFDIGVALGKKAIELHPYLQIVRVYYAQALEFSGRFDEALRQYQIASVMSPDLPWLRALEGNCLAKMGRAAEATVILGELDELRRSEYVDAYYMAVLRRGLGRTEEAWLELERAVDEFSGIVLAMHVDPKMDVFRDDPRFDALSPVERSFRPSSRTAHAVKP
jgi:DNA-binding winged helix-turn-helix (wHTH) protein